MFNIDAVGFGAGDGDFSNDVNNGDVPCREFGSSTSISSNLIFKLW